MSLRVDSSVPLTEEEKEYLLSRSGGEDLIAIDERKFGSLSAAEKKRLRKGESAPEVKPDDEGDYHSDDIEAVEALTVAQMSQALKKNGLSADVSEEELKEIGSEKEVLAIRILNFLDDKRKSK